MTRIRPRSVRQAHHRLASADGRASRRYWLRQATTHGLMAGAVGAAVDRVCDLDLAVERLRLGPEADPALMAVQANAVAKVTENAGVDGWAALLDGLLPWLRAPPEGWSCERPLIQACLESPTASISASARAWSSRHPDPRWVRAFESGSLECPSPARLLAQVSATMLGLDQKTPQAFRIRLLGRRRLAFEKVDGSARLWDGFLGSVEAFTAEGWRDRCRDEGLTGPLLDPAGPASLKLSGTKRGSLEVRGSIELEIGFGPLTLLGADKTCAVVRTGGTVSFLALDVPVFERLTVNYFRLQQMVFRPSMPPADEVEGLLVLGGGAFVVFRNLGPGVTSDQCLVTLYFLRGGELVEGPPLDDLRYDHPFETAELHGDEEARTLVLWDSMGHRRELDLPEGIAMPSGQAWVDFSHGTVMAFAKGTPVEGNPVAPDDGGAALWVGDVDWRGLMFEREAYLVSKDDFAVIVRRPS